MRTAWSSLSKRSVAHIDAMRCHLCVNASGRIIDRSNSRRAHKIVLIVWSVSVSVPVCLWLCVCLCVLSMTGAAAQIPRLPARFSRVAHSRVPKVRIALHLFCINGVGCATPHGAVLAGQTSIGQRMMCLPLGRTVVHFLSGSSRKARGKSQHC